MGKEQKRETWESLKEDGNKLFAHRKYEQGDFWLFWLKYVKILAAKLYSKALQKAPNNDVLFTNRALCKMKMKKFDDAAIDAREAISLQPMSVKDRVHIWLFVFFIWRWHCNKLWQRDTICLVKPYINSSGTMNRSNPCRR